MKIAVAIMMKCPSQSKTRLAGSMDDEARMKIASSLFERTKAFFNECFPEFERLVITPCMNLFKECERSGWVALADVPGEGLSAAASRGLAWAHARGFDRLLLVPADVPGWTQYEVRELLRAGATNDVVIASSYDNGTNALLINLAAVQAFRFRYGRNSASRHALACQERSLRHLTLCLSGLAQDVDTIEDCRRLGLAAGIGTLHA